MQTAPSDLDVAYKLVVCAGTEKLAMRPRVTSDPYASTQDTFNKCDVQIMSPNYFEDPAKPKIVRESQWFVRPAAKSK